METLIEHSESIVELTKAMIEFKSKVKKIEKRKSVSNSQGKKMYDYAPLEDILEAIKKPLQECGLNIFQTPVGEFELVTILSHTSGEFIQSRYTMKTADGRPQAIGSVITYQRRYAICSILNLSVGGDDNDAQPLKDDTPDTGKIGDAMKAELTVEMVESQKEFFNRLYLNEQDVIKSGYKFSLKSFLEKFYRVKPKVLEHIEYEYMNHKINNNLL